MTSNKQTSDTELKPCPFCGGTNLQVVECCGGFDLQCWSTDRCNASFHIGGKNAFKTKERARNSETLINGWNRRVSNE